MGAATILGLLLTPRMGAPDLIPSSSRFAAKSNNKKRQCGRSARNPDPDLGIVPDFIATRRDLLISDP